MAEPDESTDSQSGSETDPFAPENAHVVSLIMQMRIYDVLMALLTNVDAEAAKKLLNLHLDGTIFGSIPSLNGTFIANIIKDEENSSDTGESE